MRFPPILTAYAVGVALNGVLPANIGTLVMLLMYLALVAGATFPGIFSGYLVHKLFFMLVGGLVYVYLFVSVSGSFSIQLGTVTPSQRRNSSVLSEPQTEKLSTIGTGSRFRAAHSWW